MRAGVEQHERPLSASDSRSRGAFPARAAPLRRRGSGRATAGSGFRVRRQDRAQPQVRALRDEQGRAQQQHVRPRHFGSVAGFTGALPATGRSIISALYLDHEAIPIGPPRFSSRPLPGSRAFDSVSGLTRPAPASARTPGRRRYPAPPRRRSDGIRPSLPTSPSSTTPGTPPLPDTLRGVSRWVRRSRAPPSRSGLLTSNMNDLPARIDPEEAAIGRPTPTARRLVEASVSPNTRRAYAGALRRLDAWLDGRERRRRGAGRLPRRAARRAGRASSSASMTVAAACFRAKLAGQPSPAGERTARVLAGYRRTASDRGRGQARPFGVSDLAAVLATCHRPRRRGRGVESDEVALEAAGVHIRLDRFLGPVIGRHVVPLAALLVQSQPSLRPLPEGKAFRQSTAAGRGSRCSDDQCRCRFDRSGSLIPEHRDREREVTGALIAHRADFYRERPFM